LEHGGAAAASAKRLARSVEQNKEVAEKLLNLIKYMNGTWRRSRRELECAVHAGQVARSMDSMEQKRKKKVAESQADILW
jgi:Skp family chaperone for outer membrane proteins